MQEKDLKNYPNQEIMMTKKEINYLLDLLNKDHRAMEQMKKMLVQEDLDFVNEKCNKTKFKLIEDLEAAIQKNLKCVSKLAFKQLPEPLNNS